MTATAVARAADARVVGASAADTPPVSVLELRRQLGARLEPTPAEGSGGERRGLATGIEELDAALPARGVPRGRLTEVVGARGSGKTTFLRRLVGETAALGVWVAYVDAGRTLAPGDWAREGEGEGVWMVRPASAAKGAWCADVLLRSGAFALVVLDGAPPLPRAVAARLVRLARGGGSAFMVVGDDEQAMTAIPGALRLRMERQRATTGAGRGRSGRVVAITVEKGGIRRRV
ncbi:MAG: ATPase domain-containing protein, partial [Gemmatimonadaceae bacterium]